MRQIRRLLLVLAIFVVGVIVYNSSWFASPDANARVRLIAHRGVHQVYERENLSYQDCTASRIYPPTHALIENTPASMAAAFAAGADVIELDVHPTTDGQFAVFHDWDLDCRTDGSGATRDHDMAYLRTLDIGFDYTADNGETYPLRGKGLGLMPSYADIMTAFPTGKFLVHIKSRDETEGDLLAALLAEHPEWRESTWGVYGADGPTTRARSLIAGLNGFGMSSVKSCLMSYLALGWTGYMPETCRDTLVPVPINFAWAVWGWPHRFTERLAAVGSQAVLVGPLNGSDPMGGINDLETLAAVPDRFNGYVWTDRIEMIGPALGSKSETPSGSAL